MLINIFFSDCGCFQISIVKERAIMAFVASSFSKIPADFFPISFFLKLAGLIVAQRHMLF
jgi:hypothetical protein